jgi:hypothetical protein
VPKIPPLNYWSFHHTMLWLRTPVIITKRGIKQKTSTMCFSLVVSDIETTWLVLFITILPISTILVFYLLGLVPTMWYFCFLVLLHGLKRNYYVHLSNTKYCYITKCSNVDIYCRLMSLAQIINLFHY